MHSSNYTSLAEFDRHSQLKEHQPISLKAMAESLLALRPPIVSANPMSLEPLRSISRSYQPISMKIARDVDGLARGSKRWNQVKMQTKTIAVEEEEVSTSWLDSLRRNALFGLAVKIFIDVSSSFRDEFPVPRGAPQATGTLAGAISLVAGSTVGAGILALPAKTIDAGFGPSVLAILMCWVFFSATGLLIAEVNVNTVCALEKNAVSFESMAQETLGTVGARLSGAADVFIAYALLVAYMIQGGSLLLQFLNPVISSSMTLPSLCGPILFVLIAGGAVFAGTEQQVIVGNTILFGVVLATFASLVALGLPHVDASLLMHTNVDSIVPAIPVIIVSLVFHNIIPTVCHQLGCDMNKIRTAIVAGSGIPVLMYIIWTLVILGTVPVQAVTDGSLFDPLESLRTSGDSFGISVSAFSACALLASFVGTLLSLVDYFADVFAKPLGIGASLDPFLTEDEGKIHTNTEEVVVSRADPVLMCAEKKEVVVAESRYTASQRSMLFASSLCPPLMIALYDPSLFFAALDNAGTFGNLLLFGIIPVAMVWQQRYGAKDQMDEDSNSELAVPSVLPGGRFTLALMMSGAGAVFMLEGYERFAGAFSL
jgi:tyrosine-specific transport protein